MRAAGQVRRLCERVSCMKRRKKRGTHNESVYGVALFHQKGFMNRKRERERRIEIDGKGKSRYSSLFLLLTASCGTTMG